MVLGLLGADGRQAEWARRYADDSQGVRSSLSSARLFVAGAEGQDVPLPAAKAAGDRGLHQQVHHPADWRGSRINIHCKGVFPDNAFADVTLRVVERVRNSARNRKVWLRAQCVRSAWLTGAWDSRHPISPAPTGCSQSRLRQNTC